MGNTTDNPLICFYQAVTSIFDNGTKSTSTATCWISPERPAWVAATSDAKAPEGRKAMMNRVGSFLSSQEAGYSWIFKSIMEDYERLLILLTQHVMRVLDSHLYQKGLGVNRYI